jgi:hypothetical protein
MPLPFSITAVNDVETIAISYDDLNHFPDDVKSLLVKNTKERLEFLKQ